MRKKILLSLGVLFGLVIFVSVNHSSNNSNSQVKGIQAIAIPTTPTSSPTLTPTATPTEIPTLTPTPIISTQNSSGSKDNLSNDNYYTNSNGSEVQSPAYSTDNSAPQGATAKCRDGTYSFSQHRQGTCSHHGGVAKWL